MKKSRQLIAGLSLAGVLMTGSVGTASTADAHPFASPSNTAVLENYVPTAPVPFQPQLEFLDLTIGNRCTPRLAILSLC